MWSRFLSVEIRWLAKQIRPFLHWHAASFVCITAGSLLALMPPLVFRWLIDGIIPQRRLGLLLCAVAMIFLAHEGRTVLNNFGSYLMLSAAQKMGLSLRMSLLRHLNSLSADYYDETPVGAAIYPFKEPIEEISYFGSDFLPAILRTLLTSGLTLFTMFVLSPLLTFIVLPLIPAFLITRRRYRRKLMTDGDAMQHDLLIWTNFLQEHLAAAIPIQLLAQERRQERRAFRLMARAARSQQQFYRTAIGFTVFSSLAVVLAMSAVIGYGGVGVLSGTLSLGSLVAFYGFVSQMFDPLSSAAELYARTQKIFASVRQLQSVLALRPTVANPSVGVSINDQWQSAIVFREVEFGYTRQKDLLRIPSLCIRPGEHMAIAGENGAGKSTLVKLIARLYDPTAGSIQLGAQDLRQIHLKSLRKSICYLPREPVLFDGTIASNLRFVRPDASEEELQLMLKYVGLSSLVASLPDSLHQRVGPDGCQLSGGERQRLAIARALLQKPKVIILDEATSCLDPSSERTVLQNLRSLLSTSTLIVVSHRAKILSAFRRVVLLSNGRIVRDNQGITSISSPPSRVFNLAD